MSQGFSSRSTIKRSPNHVATDMSGETVVLDMKSGMYYGMEGVAGLIWNLLEKPQTIENLQAAVLAEYEIDVASCERDVAAFVTALQSAGLIEVTHENAA